MRRVIQIMREVGMTNNIKTSEIENSNFFKL